tara:strand:+ start:676 stop:1383 length:708 start_codon:yes stop_codon:yes gene_type:complete
MGKNLIICDLDGTIANIEHRLHYIKGPKKDWPSFNKACVHDTVNKDVREILWNMYDAGRKNGERPTDLQKVSDRFIYFFSGRSEAVRKETEEWLHRWVVSPSNCKEVEINKDEFDEICGNGRAYTTREYNDKYFQLRPYLYMRKEGDFRNDIEVKREMIHSLNIKPDDVLCILDDRQGVVDMWREEGFRCLQVDAWKEEPKRHHLMDADLGTLNKEELIFLIKKEREFFNKRLAP